MAKITWKTERVGDKLRLTYIWEDGRTESMDFCAEAADRFADVLMDFSHSVRDGWVKKHIAKRTPEGKDGSGSGNK